MPLIPRTVRSQGQLRRHRFGLSIIALAVALSIVPAFPGASTASAAPGDPVLYEQTDARIAWSGAWTQGASASLSGGTQALGRTSGAAATFAFVGTRVDVIGMTGPKAGVALVSLDGGAPVSVDLYSVQTAFGQTIFSAPGLDNGMHTLSLTVAGTASPASADTYVSVDAVRVSGELVGWPVEQNDTRIVRRGSWTQLTAAGLSGGSHLLTSTPGDEIAIEFSGTRLDLAAMTGPKSGIATVSVDGGAPLDVDFYAAQTGFRSIVYSTGDLPAGTHTLRLVCSGRKNPASAGAFVGLDAVLPVGTLAQAVIRYEENDWRFAYNGEIRAQEGYAGPSGNRYAWAGPRWGAVAVTFTGARLDWIGTVGPQFGIASVRIDGGPPQYVDLYSPEFRLQQRVFTTGTIAHGTHTVVFSWTGRRNPAATDNLIAYDAFEVGGDPVQAAPPGMPPEAINFNYPWARYIVVDKSEFRLYFVENGSVVKTYPVAVGAVGATTPNAIWRIDAKYYTDPFSVYGPRKMRMFRQSGSGYVFTAYAIHGTNNPASIGTRASHGCIRMYNHDVLEFFPMVPLGTMVVTRD